MSQCLSIFCSGLSTFSFFLSDGEVLEFVHVRMLDEDEEGKSINISLGRFEQKLRKAETPLKTQTFKLMYINQNGNVYI